MLPTALRGVVVIELKDGTKLAVNKHACADPEGGNGQRPPPPLEKFHKNIGFLSNSSPDHLKNYEASEPAFNVVPSWCFTGGPMTARLCL